MKEFKIESEVLKKVTTAMGTVKGFATFTIGTLSKQKKEGKITASVCVVSGGAQITYSFFVERPSDYEELINEDKTLVPYITFTVEASAFIDIANTLANYGEAIVIKCEEGGSEVCVGSAQAEVKLPLVENDKIPLPLPANYTEGFAMVKVDTKNFISMVRKGASLCSGDKDTSGIGKVKCFSLIGADKFVGKSTSLVALEKAECVASIQYHTHNLANTLLEERIASITAEDSKILAEKKGKCVTEDGAVDVDALIELAKSEGIALDRLDFCLNASGLDTVKAVLGIDNVNNVSMIVTKNYLHIAAGYSMCTVTLANKLVNDVYSHINKFLEQEEYLDVTVDASRLLNDLAVLNLNKDNSIGANIQISPDGLVFSKAGAKAVTPIVKKNGELKLNAFYSVNLLKEIIAGLDKGNVTLRFLGNVLPVIVRNGDLEGNWDTVALIMAINPDVVSKNKEQTEKSE